MLWPNLLGLSFARGARPGRHADWWVRDDAIGVPKAWPLLLVAVGAAGLAHPKVWFSVVVLSVFFAAAALVRRTARR